MIQSIKRFFRKEPDGLVFDEEYLKEYFKQIGVFQGMKVFDVEHAEARWYERFDHLSWENTFKKVLNKGIKKIDSKYNRDPHTYMIYSRKGGFKIPLDIRPDRKNPTVIIGAVSTVLGVDEHPRNLRNEIDVYVEGLQAVIDRLKETTAKTGGYAIFDEIAGDPFFKHIIENGEHRHSHRIIEVDEE